MAVNLPVGSARYSFQDPQQYAMQLRLTPEVRDALLKAQQTGDSTTLRLTGTGSDNAITVGSQSFAFHPPTAQERLDLFSQSLRGCTQLGHIHQKAVVKRATLQGLGRQPIAAQGSQAQNAQRPGPAYAAHKPSAGPADKGRTQLPSVQPVRKQQPGGVQPQAVPRPAVQQKQAMVPLHSQRPSHPAAAAGLSKPTQASRAMPAPKQAQVRPPPPASGSHPSSQHQAAAQTHPPAHPSSQHAPSGMSNQSAQTSLAPKPPKGKAGKAGKAPANANYVSAQQPGVLENVYAAARKGQKEAMLVAMLLCKPCKDKVLEEVLKDTEKKVTGFQRLQGDSFKRACRQYAAMVSGSVWVLREPFLGDANTILHSLSASAETNGTSGQPAQPSAAAKKSNAEPEAARQRKKSAEPQQRYPTPDPQEMEGVVVEPQPTHAADKVKKKKRLTKAADMGKTPQGMEGDRPPGAGVKRKLQAAGPTDSESGEDSAAAKRQRKAHKGPSGLRPPTHSGTPPPSAAGLSPQHQSAHVNGHSEQRNSQGQRWQNEDEAPGNRAGSIGAEGRSASMEAPVTNGDRGQVAAAAPSVGKIKLKLRRPWSADEYDESWFAECVDRQPKLRGPITDFHQWEECCGEYRSKRALYFRLHQEMQDTNIKMKGLQQAIHEAGSDTEKVKYEQQFELLWKRRLPRSHKWDKAFYVLQDELEALHKHMQIFYDQRATPMETA